MYEKSCQSNKSGEVNEMTSVCTSYQKGFIVSTNKIDRDSIFAPKEVGLSWRDMGFRNFVWRADERLPALTGYWSIIWNSLTTHDGVWKEVEKTSTVRNDGACSEIYLDQSELWSYSMETNTSALGQSLYGLVFQQIGHTRYISLRDLNIPHVSLIW